MGERRRREAAEDRERLIQHELLRVSRCINIWFYGGNQGAIQITKDVIASVPLEETASISKLLDMNGRLVCGDVWGGIRTYEWTQSIPSDNNLSVSRRQYSLLQFRGFSIACMEQVGEHLLAAALQPVQDSRGLPSALSLRATSPRGIYIVNIQTATIL